jgi:hypothetical protein
MMIKCAVNAVFREITLFYEIKYRKKNVADKNINNIKS